MAKSRDDTIRMIDQPTIRVPEYLVIGPVRVSLATGAVEFGDQADINEAARLFWDAVAKMWGQSHFVSAAAGEPLTIIYTNWRGETAERTIQPVRLWYGKTDWHPEPQWLLKAIDIEKGAERDFAWAAIDFQGDGGASPPSVTDAEVEAACGAYRETASYPIVPGNHGQALRAVLEAAARVRGGAK